MRIALTITELDVGGAEKCIADLAIWLAGHGSEVKVFAIGPEPAAGFRGLLEQLEEQHIDCSFGGFRGLSRTLKAKAWLHDSLSAFEPDIVQSMLFHANVLTAVSRPKDSVFVGGARVRQVQRSRQLIQAWSARKMERLVCVSQDVAEHCERVEGIPSKKLTVIPNGITLPQLAPHTNRAPNIPPGRFILAIGRLSDQKGFRELLQDADGLLEPLPDHQLVILGSGPQRAELEDLKQNCNSGQRIHLAGWQPNVDQWLAACDLFILPTHYEGMPNALLEAMSHAKAVVVNDADGVRQVLGEGELASVQLAAPLKTATHPQGSASDLINKALKLSLTPTLAAEAGAYNLKRIKEHFNLEDQLAKYYKLYQTLLERSG
ncbi:MAG TPA: hypothetical protein DDW52_06790 [Planctomycetaceae bacterium]|nr:hypothetical protein [Planctomycetaceae bacterium]